MDDYCKEYRYGSLCEKVNMHVPESFCKIYCKGDYEKYKHVDKNIGKNKVVHQKSKPQQMPTLVEMAKTFSIAMAGFAKGGFKLVDRTEYFKRRLICEKCEERRKGRCGKCGCNLKMKSALATEKCPMNFWKETYNGN